MQEQMIRSGTSERLTTGCPNMGATCSPRLFAPCTGSSWTMSPAQSNKLDALAALSNGELDGPFRSVSRLTRYGTGKDVLDFAFDARVAQLAPYAANVGFHVRRSSTDQINGGSAEPGATGGGQ